MHASLWPIRTVSATARCECITVGAAGEGCGVHRVFRIHQLPRDPLSIDRLTSPPNRHADVSRVFRLSLVLPHEPSRPAQGERHKPGIGLELLAQTDVAYFCGESRSRRGALDRGTRGSYNAPGQAVFLEADESVETRPRALLLIGRAGRCTTGLSRRTSSFVQVATAHPWRA
jgi:hypothetical protein